MAEFKIDIGEILTTAGCSQAVIDVARERVRQISKEGWSIQHDDEHEAGAMASAGACYAHRAQFELRPKNESKPLPELDVDPVITNLWPWDEAWWKPKAPRPDLVRAAALIIAEIERIDRLTQGKTGNGG